MCPVRPVRSWALACFRTHRTERTCPGLSGLSGFVVPQRQGESGDRRQQHARGVSIASSSPDAGRASPCTADGAGVTGAERMRRARQRKREGVVLVQVFVTRWGVDRLVALGLLGAEQMQEATAIRHAAQYLLGEALGRGRKTDGDK